MKFWQALLTGFLASIFVEGEMQNHGFWARMVHDGLGVLIVWIAWRAAERDSDREANHG